MKCSDIPDEHVIELARSWVRDRNRPGIVTALVSEGIPKKLAIRKVEILVNKGRLEYGVSLNYAWPNRIEEDEMFHDGTG